MLEEEEIEVPVAVSKSDSPNDSIPSENDVKMEDAKIPTDAPSSGAESNAPDVEGKPVQMETDLKVRVLILQDNFFHLGFLFMIQEYYWMGALYLFLFLQF